MSLSLGWADVTSGGCRNQKGGNACHSQRGADVTREGVSTKKGGDACHSQWEADVTSGGRPNHMGGNACHSLWGGGGCHSNYREGISTKRGVTHVTLNGVEAWHPGAR